MTSKHLYQMTAIASTLLTLMTWITCPKEKTLMIEWNMMKLMSTNMTASLMIDLKASAFASCVLLITTSILMYSSYYMKESKKKTTFLKLIMAFIVSMMILIFSPNMISMIMGWEGLGMTSFILIMHYQNSKSLNSSFYTMIMNRMGDIMMMMSMASMMTLNSWMFTSMMFTPDITTLLTMMVAAFSKSAQIPFSSWLTEAMAAPTPISALVHSSTLVTAGIILFIRFEPILKYKKTNTLILMVSMTTLIMASMNSTTEWDIKKIVALSTLSQMSMMFITISMNLFNLAMFHLLVHATFKALIFLCSSSFISFANTQDIRKMNKLAKNMFMTKASFNLATLTLCGFPFMSSFYSKEMIMEMMIVKKSNSLITVMFYACMAATLFYSFKTLLFINSTNFPQTLTPQKETTEQKMSKMMLLIPAVLYGNKMNWIININFKIPHTTPAEKMIPTLMMTTMMMLIKEINKTTMQEKMNNSTYKMMTNYMWFMKNLSIQVKLTSTSKFKETFSNTEKTLFNKMIKSSSTLTKLITKKNFILTHKTTTKINLMMMTMTILMM